MANNENQELEKKEESSINFIEEKKQELQKFELESIKDNFEKLSTDEIKDVHDRLYKMIDYAVKRQDWYADQCHRLLQIGLGLIASGVAIIALFSNLENLQIVTKILGGIEGLIFFFTGLKLTDLFNRSLAGNHPYRNLVNISSWFYYYNFPEEYSEQNLSEDPNIAKEQVNQESDYIKNVFIKFLDQTTDKNKSIREDIEQVSVLFLLQKYKREKAQQMANALSTGICLTFLFFVFLILSFFLQFLRMK